MIYYIVLEMGNDKGYVFIDSKSNDIDDTMIYSGSKIRAKQVLDELQRV